MIIDCVVKGDVRKATKGTLHLRAGSVAVAAGQLHRGPGQPVAQGMRRQHLDLGADAEQLLMGVADRLDRDPRVYPAFVVGLPGGGRHRLDDRRLHQMGQSLQSLWRQPHARLFPVPTDREISQIGTPVCNEIEVGRPTEMPR